MYFLQTCICHCIQKLIINLLNMKNLIFFLSLTYSFTCWAGFKIEGTYAFPKKTTYLTIYKNGDSYEGKISWIETNKKDEKNPNPALRNRDFLDMVILKNLKQTNENLYTDGFAYDPESGNTFRCKIWFQPDDENSLHVRGYIGIPLLGRSEILSRIE